jgi:beta-galactosidase/beta-glucuronidase
LVKKSRGWVGFRRMIGAVAAGWLMTICGPTTPAVGAPPGTVLLADGWELARDLHDLGMAEGWASGGGAQEWVSVRVPHVVEVAPLEEHFAGTVSWYRFAFRGPVSAPAFSWAVRFEQVRRTARVWLNGVEIGSSGDAYSPFELAATGLRPGEHNQLVVRVDSRRPAGLREGWWTGAG